MPDSVPPIITLGTGACAAASALDLHQRVEFGLQGAIRLERGLAGVGFGIGSDLGRFCIHARFVPQQLGRLLVDLGFGGAFDLLAQAICIWADWMKWSLDNSRRA